MRPYVRKEIKLLQNAAWHLQFMTLAGHPNAIMPKEVDEGDIVALLYLYRALRGIEV